MGPREGVLLDGFVAGVEGVLKEEYGWPPKRRVLELSRALIIEP